MSLKLCGAMWSKRMSIENQYFSRPNVKEFIAESYQQLDLDVQLYFFSPDCEPPKIIKEAKLKETFIAKEAKTLDCTASGREPLE